MEKTLRVSQVARELGCSEGWLRDADRAGRIPKARRDLNGWRVYTEDDLKRLKALLVPD